MSSTFFNSSVWNSLKFNAGSAIAGLANLNWRISSDSGSLVYKNPRYKSVMVYAAQQLLMSELEGRLHKIIPKYKKHYENTLRQKVLEQQTANHVQLIQDQQIQSAHWGRITVAEGNHDIIARDKYGTLVAEALMLYYDDDETHTVRDTTVSNQEISYSTCTVCHIDLAPQMTVSSNKNIVMTQVQGRDYSRKELVSGGDLQFSISGNVVSDQMGVYPTEKVKKFVQIMEHNGILNANFMMFEPFNVNRIIVRSYSLGQPTCKNIQPYSFECVAVEPDDEVKVTTDTISTINKTLELSPMDKWYKLILDNKKVTTAADTIITSSVTTAAGSTLDELVKNI